jgi:hypothetical protein
MIPFLFFSLRHLVQVKSAHSEKPGGWLGTDRAFYAFEDA